MGRHAVNVYGDQLQIDFHDDLVYVSLSRWREVRGDVWAEVVVRTRAPGVLPHLHTSRWNLSSMSQRAALARLLRSRYRDPDWADILERVALIALEHRRAGEPVVKVGRLDAPPQDVCLVDPVLVRRELNLVYGDEATGKSFLAVALAVAVQSGVSILGWPVLGPAPVLYLDYETTPEEIDARVKLVAAGLGIETPEIAYLRGVGTLADQAQEVSEKVAGVQPVLVIVDSVGYACGAVEGSSDWSGPFLRMAHVMRSWRTTVLLIDHATDDRPYGSRYKMASARSVWHLKKQQEAGDRVIHAGLIHRKRSNGALHPPIGYRLRFSPGMVAFDRADLMDVPELAEHLSAWTRIRAMLAKGAVRSAVIAEELDLPHNIVRARLSEHRRRGEVDERDGYWFLASDRAEVT